MATKKSSPGKKTPPKTASASVRDSKKVRKKTSRPGAAPSPELTLPAPKRTGRTQRPDPGEPRGVTKRFLKTRPVCKVTFRLPAEEGGRSAAVAGDFSNWKPLPMKALRKGGFSLVLELGTGQSYQYRYIVDGVRWCNDWQADEYVRNRFGWDNCLINL